MKIALVNYRYFISGGPERYMFNIKDLLERKGHTVIPYSVQHALNEKSEYEADFLSPMGKGNEIYFSDVSKYSVSSLIKGLSRIVYSIEAKKSFRQFLDKYQPDVVYVLFYQHKMSCSIVDAAYEAGIPVIHRISDYSLITPCSMMYNHRKRCLCEKCLHGSYIHAILGKCIYNSAVFSAIKVLALQVQKWRHIHKKTTAYIFPSVFTMKKFIEAGFAKEKFYLIPTFFNSFLLKETEITWGDYALYVGRIDSDKGLGTLIEAFAGTPYKLKIVGYTSKGYLDELYSKLSGVPHHIEFLGRMDFAGIQKVLAECLFTVVPSEWYDNLPNVLLESFAIKKCVVASNLGSLAENIENGKTGLLFECKNAEDLRRKAEFLFQNRNKAKEWGTNAFNCVQTRFNVANHYNSLMGVFNNVIQKNEERDSK